MRDNIVTLTLSLLKDSSDQHEHEFLSLIYYEYMLGLIGSVHAAGGRVEV